MAKATVEHGQTRRLGDLKPHPKNSRTHPPEQIEKLVASMTEFDMTRPLFIDDKDVILAGHGAWEAATKKFGVDFEVPVSIAKGWTEAKKRAYVIADNQLASLSSWDVPMLRSELQELHAVKGMELKPLGFTALQAQGILEPPVVAPAKQSSRTGTGVIQFNIVFDDAEQQQRWFAFSRKIKAAYPEPVTFAAKLHKFLEDQV